MKDMTNKELQEYLKKFPDEMEVRMLPEFNGTKTVIEKAYRFTQENIIKHSDTAFVDDEAPEDEWDMEDGKLDLGSGEPYLLFNAPVY